MSINTYFCSKEIPFKSALMKLYPIISDLWKMDGGVAFGVVPKSIWNRSKMADENNMIPIVTRCLLIETGNRLILVDAGLGNKRDEKYYKVRYRAEGPSLAELIEQKGFRKEQVTDVLLTHLHDDHVGALTEKSEDGSIRLVFPNASYHCTATQWDWAIHPNKREVAAYFPDNLLPLEQSGKLNLITEEGEFLPGIRLRIYNGHTIGQMIPFIQVDGKTVVFSGDFIPTAYNIPMPFVPSVDVQPLITMKEKAEFLNEAVKEGYILLFQHDYFNECCNLIQTEKGVAADKIFTLAEALNQAN